MADWKAPLFSAAAGAGATKSELRLLAALCDLQGGRFPVAYGGCEALVRATGLHRSTVFRWRRRMVALGVLRVVVLSAGGRLPGGRSKATGFGLGDTANSRRNATVNRRGNATPKRVDPSGINGEVPVNPASVTPVVRGGFREGDAGPVHVRDVIRELSLRPAAAHG